MMSGAPFGYRYVSVQEGGGQAQFEPVTEQARVVKQIFSWVAQDRCSLSEVCRRLEKAGEPTATGKRTWSRQAVWHVLQNPAYQGKAAYGKTQMTLRDKEARLRAARGRPSQPRRSNRPVDTDPKDWVFCLCSTLDRLKVVSCGACTAGRESQPRAPREAQTRLSSSRAYLLR